MNKTNIGWTQYSSNPIYAVNKETGKRGWYCTHVSPGCTNCYAETLNVGRWGNGLAYVAQNRDKAEFRLNEKELDAIISRKKPTLIFMLDMSDLFHEDMPIEFIDKVFATMALAQQHTFQVLTKRPEHMRAYVSDLRPPYVARRGQKVMYTDWQRGVKGRIFEIVVNTPIYRDWREANPSADLCGPEGLLSWPLSNVWLGTSVEDQKRADERIPILLDTPAVVRFLSIEPLLGEVNLAGHLRNGHLKGLHWCIVGGESGSNHRPMDMQWLELLSDQCWCAEIPLFVKQDSGQYPGQQGRISDELWAEKLMPHAYRGGAVLDESPAQHDRRRTGGLAARSGDSSGGDHEDA